MMGLEAAAGAFVCSTAWKRGHDQFMEHAMMKANRKARRDDNAVGVPKRVACARAAWPCTDVGMVWAGKQPDQQEAASLDSTQTQRSSVRTCDRKLQHQEVRTWGLRGDVMDTVTDQHTLEVNKKTTRVKPRQKHFCGKQTGWISIVGPPMNRSVHE